MRSKLCIITIVACAALTGCSNVPDLSHVDNDLTAQYMADALLKNDDSYQGVLDYDHSILEATPSPTAEPTPAVTVAPTQVVQMQAVMEQVRIIHKIMIRIL